MGKLNRDAKRYLREIQSWLPCTGRVKGKMLGEIRSRLKEFLLENPVADYEAIIERFGTPKQIASSYVDEMATGEMLKGLRIRKKAVALISTLAIIMFALWLCVVSYECAYNQNVTNGYVEVSVVQEKGA